MFASTMNAHLFPHEICATAGNFTANGTYQTTLTALLSSISTTNSLSLTYGFFNASAAVSGTSQTLYVVGSCRGDLTAESCRTCLEAATSDIRRLCPLRKAAVLYCENCTVRYSSTSIFGTVATDPDYQVVNVNNVTSPDTYNSALKTLLDELRGEAAGGSFLRKYATGDASTGFDSIYAMTQCTPDLTKQECSDCLVTVIGRLTWCCAGKMGVLIVAPSCQFRYETNNRFFGPISEPLLPLPASSSPKTDALPPPRGKSNKSTGIILVVAIGVGEGLVFFFFACCFCPKKATGTYADVQGDRNGINEITKEDVVTDAESPQYDLATIRATTANFSHQNKLGEGGFGEVFKGKLPNGQLIAVKRLSQSSEQGTVEFKNEVILLAKLQHRNLVQLLGFSLEGEQKLLVYEFVPNKSLDYFLFDPQKSRQLNWSTRYQIACGVARGVLYLHRDSRLESFTVI
ncbi:cysteine-rich receptor-like protein kinase 25 [Eucalyptus grandis]|uniref:cysteine-rich receptor-like protein kinase 25 n=1 Tax=Eucalyptus grandis TaxID=71139 RepID=UPI00192E98BE|nr:cysteine-rich receptor-like protein kinase 25 [Eucalyptus grandis]